MTLVAFPIIDEKTIIATSTSRPIRRILERTGETIDTGILELEQHTCRMHHTPKTPEYQWNHYYAYYNNGTQRYCIENWWNSMDEHDTALQRFQKLCKEANKKGIRIHETLEQRTEIYLTQQQLAKTY